MIKAPKRRRRVASTDRYIPYTLKSAHYHVKDINTSEKAHGLELGLANALGFDENDARVFRFNRIRNPEHDENQWRPVRTATQSTRHKVKINHGISTLDAPGLLNDYYSTLVAWSPVSKHVAVGMGSQVYIWINYAGSIMLPLPVDYGVVTCLAFSCDNVLAIGRKDGSLMLYDLAAQRLRAMYQHIESPMSFIVWIPFSPSDMMFGDEVGTVCHLRLTRNKRGEFMEQGARMKCHNQQVCGIAISPDRSQMAVGGNDNLVTIWSIENLLKPRLQFKMHHKAAVKALAFCPWAPGLLATGGGTHDRTVRFWHSRTGTLLESHTVKAQVTGIIWSPHYKQLVVTFGFGDHEHPILACVYSYPKFRPLMQVPQSSVTRILSAVLSPEGDAICCAANDNTVRFYELWQGLQGKISTPQAGLYGSDIIQMLEGIDKPGELIR